MEKSGIGSETKALLDGFLKTDLKKKTRSRRNLVSEDDSVSSAEAGRNAAVVDVHREEGLSVENKAYILDKFLNNSRRETVRTPTGPPVPKPRKKKSEAFPHTDREIMDMDTLKDGKTFALSKSTKSNGCSKEVSEGLTTRKVEENLHGTSKIGDDSNISKHSVLTGYQNSKFGTKKLSGRKGKWINSADVCDDSQISQHFERGKHKFSKFGINNLSPLKDKSINSVVLSDNSKLSEHPELKVPDSKGESKNPTDLCNDSEINECFQFTGNRFLKNGTEKISPLKSDSKNSVDLNDDSKMSDLSELGGNKISKFGIKQVPVSKGEAKNYVDLSNDSEMSEHFEIQGNEISIFGTKKVTVSNDTHNTDLSNDSSTREHSECSRNKISKLCTKKVPTSKVESKISADSSDDSKLAGSCNINEVTRFRTKGSSEELVLQSVTRKTKRNKPNATIGTYDYEKILSVTVHRTDRLLLDSYVVHPIVKVHLVDGNSGEYVKKSNNSRSIVFYYENKDIDYIGPFMTQAYGLQENRSLQPNWEESILINEDLAFVTSNHSIILIFEMMDFLSTAVIKQSGRRGQLGWHRIAWAFLKLSAPAFSNVGKKLRLQLYYPAEPKKTLPPEKCDIFHWWQKKKFRSYPSTLHVTVKAVLSPATVIETWRSRAPHEIERGRLSDGSQRNASDNADSVVEPSAGSAKRQTSVPWSRWENRVRNVPDLFNVKYHSCGDGCFVMKFSNDGRYLACSVLQDGIYAVAVYSVLNDELVRNLSGHQGLIYSISWSEDDRLLITASADSTVCIWDTTTFKFLQLLPHPSFVYSSVIHERTIITGCYDTFIRVWSFNKNMEYELREELKEHIGYVTSLCFNKNGLMFYSSDSVGVIDVWKFGDGRWQFKKDIKVLDLRAVVINQLLLHKRERRLLVNSRDSKIRLVDIKTGYVLQTYINALNNRILISCALSPCSTFLLSGSENGEIHTWNTETGQCERTYKPYNMQLAINCVQYHPKDDIIAVGHYGNNLPILIFKCPNDGKEGSNSEENSRRIDKVSIVSESSTDFGGHRENLLNFREILKKMDHLISPK